MIFDIPARHKQLCGIGRTALLFQNKGSVRTPRQTCRARHLVEHIAVVLLADMVDDHHRKGMPVGKVLYQRYIAVIVGVGVVFGSGAYLLQRINDNEPAVGIYFQIVLKLYHQTVRELAARHGEMELPVCFIGQTE